MRVMIVAVGLVLAVGVGVARAQTTETAKKPVSNELKVPLVNSQGQSAGTVTFKQVKQGVKMTVKLENIPFGEHGVHIHEHAVCDAPDFKAAGGHFNPAGKHHGFENPEGHHNGGSARECVGWREPQGREKLCAEGCVDGSEPAGLDLC